MKAPDSEVKRFRRRSHTERWQATVCCRGSQTGRTGKSVVVAGLLLGSSAASGSRIAETRFSHRLCGARSDKQGKPWDAWYAFLTEKHGLSKKPAFIGMSKGGVNEFNWAVNNPDKVSCIYADNPAIYKDDLAKLDELAASTTCRCCTFAARSIFFTTRMGTHWRLNDATTNSAAASPDDQRRHGPSSAQPRQCQADCRLDRAEHQTFADHPPAVRRQFVSPKRTTTVSTISYIPSGRRRKPTPPAAAPVLLSATRSTTPKRPASGTSAAWESSCPRKLRRERRGC